jgi:hypothetical protein
MFGFSYEVELADAITEIGKLKRENESLKQELRDIKDRLTKASNNGYDPDACVLGEVESLLIENGK